MALERLWAGWRSDYLRSVTDAEAGGTGPDTSRPACVFCGILGSGLPDEETHVVWRGERCAVLLNAYPYASGHVLVLPLAHEGELEALDDATSSDLWEAARTAVAAIRAAYGPDGVNLGANLGRAAGAGVPGHLHLHALPRWSGDSNFMTSVAEARVLPEPLDVTWSRLREAWPADRPAPTEP